MRELVSICAVVVVFSWAALLWKRATRAAVPGGAFGVANTHEEGWRKEATEILRTYVIEQRWAFGLVWVAAVVAGFLAAEAFRAGTNSGHMETAALAYVGGVVGDVLVGGAALRLYGKCCDRVNQGLETLAQVEGAGRRIGRN